MAQRFVRALCQTFTDLESIQNTSSGPPIATATSLRISSARLAVSLRLPFNSFRLIRFGKSSLHSWRGEEKGNSRYRIRMPRLLCQEPRLRGRKTLEQHHAGVRFRVRLHDFKQNPYKF